MAFINAIRSAISWVVRYFFLIAFGILVAFYLQWFSLEPLEFDGFDNLSLLGILLLLFYGLFTVLTITEGKSRLRPFLIRIGLLFLLITGLYAAYSLPSFSRDAFSYIEIILLLFYGLFIAMEKTEKSKPWIRTTLVLIVILLLGLMAVVFVLLSGAYVAYNTWRNFEDLVLCVEIILLLFYLFYGPFTVITKRARGEYWLRPFFAFAAILFLLINSLYVAFGMPILITSVECNGTTYSITSDGNSGSSDFDDYRLTIGKGLFDHKASSLGDYDYYWSSKLTCDKNTNVVRLFASPNRLVRDFGAQSYIYDLQDDVQDSIKNIDYSLYSYAINDIPHYLVSACSSNLPDACKFISVDQSVIPAPLPAPCGCQYKYSVQPGNLLIDQKTGDVYILIDGKIYADLQNQSRKISTIVTMNVIFYTPRGSTNPTKLYGLAVYQTNQTYVYVLYVCNNDSDGCATIPFSYTTSDRQNASLDVNQANQLNVSIGGKLVFTYSPPPDP